MNLADSAKKVLKYRSHNIFSGFWKDDVKGILLDVVRDVSRMGRAGVSSVKNFNPKKIKPSLAGVMDSGSDALLILRVLPGRIRDGFLIFKEEFIQELENQTNQKQKTIFCLKVFGTLTSSSLGTIYNIKKGKIDFRLRGLKRKNEFTYFIITELIFRISQVFIYRFLSELEKEITHPDDLKTVRYLKELLSNKVPHHPQHTDENHELIVSDRSIEVIENLKRFIMTGK